MLPNAPPDPLPGSSFPIPLLLPGLWAVWATAAVSKGLGATAAVVPGSCGLVWAGVARSRAGCPHQSTAPGSPGTVHSRSGLHGNSEQGGRLGSPPLGDATLQSAELLRLEVVGVLGHQPLQEALGGCIRVSVQPDEDPGPCELEVVRAGPPLSCFLRWCPVGRPDLALIR